VLREFATRVVTEGKPLTAARFKEIMNEVKTATGAKGKELFHPIRIALTGSAHGPEFDKLVPLMEEGAILAFPQRVVRIVDRAESFLNASEFEDAALLEHLVSVERFKSYRIACGGGLVQAYRLYRQNSVYSEALYGMLQHLEVFLRNGFHEQAKLHFGCDAWFDRPGLLLQKEYKSVLKAKGKLKAEGKPEAAGRIVAEMTFGFWVNLLTSSYAHSLWVPALNNAFNVRISRKVAYQRLERIRKLRNRIAHHEPMFSGNLPEIRDMLLDTASWLSPFARRWMEENENLTKNLTSNGALFQRGIIST